MLALINLIIRRTRLAFRTPARLALFPLLSQSGCFILQLPTGFYSHCCRSGSEPSRREQRERGSARGPPTAAPGRAGPGGKQRAGGRSRPWGGRWDGAGGVGCGRGGVGGGSVFLPRGGVGELGWEGSQPGPLAGVLGATPTPKTSQRALEPSQGLKHIQGRVSSARTPSLAPCAEQRAARRSPTHPGRETSQGTAGTQRGAEPLRRGAPRAGAASGSAAVEGQRRAGGPALGPAEQVSAGLPVLIKLIKPPIQH